MLYNSNSYTKFLDLLISSLTIIRDFHYATLGNQTVTVLPDDINKLNSKITELTTYRDKLIRDFTNAFNNSPEILKIINDTD